jgi:hypothetical protein
MSLLPDKSVRRDSGSDEPYDVSRVRALARAATLQRMTPNRGDLPSPLSPVVICVARNEGHRINEFLYHYRLLGIHRFFFVDNGSTDGSPNFLMRQPDVDLFVTDEQFDWRRKHGWITRLIDDHGRDRWYLIADADEHVVFAGADDNALLCDVTTTIASRGGRRIRGCLVDMYSQGPVLMTCRKPGTTMHDVYSYFDPGGYAEHRNSLLVSRIGGPRRRVFSKINPGFEPQLTKYPLFHLRPDELAVNPHYIWPPDSSPEDRCYLGILHYKFNGDFLKKIEDAVGRQQYWNYSAEYFTYLEAFRREPLLSLYCAASRRYCTPGDLVVCDLIEPVLEGSELRFERTVQTAAQRARAQRLAGLNFFTTISDSRLSISSTK